MKSFRDLCDKCGIFVEECGLFVEDIEAENPRSICFQCAHVKVVQAKDTVELVRGVAYLNPDGTISHRVMYGNPAQDCYQHSGQPVQYRFDGAGPLPKDFCLSARYTVRLEYL